MTEKLKYVAMMALAVISFIPALLLEIGIRMIRSLASSCMDERVKDVYNNMISGFMDKFDGKKL